MTPTKLIVLLLMLVPLLPHAIAEPDNNDAQTPAACNYSVQPVAGQGYLLTSITTSCNKPVTFWGETNRRAGLQMEDNLPYYYADNCQLLC